jgi:hypothetical protein
MREVLELLYSLFLALAACAYVWMLERQKTRLWALLDRYEALQASIIADNECWKDQDEECLPSLTGDQWDEWISIQETQNGLNETYRPVRRTN